jgi:SAM-dependent methyltransferase
MVKMKNIFSVAGITPMDWISFLRTRPILYEHFPKITNGALLPSGLSANHAVQNSSLPYLKWTHYFAIYDQIINEFNLTFQQEEERKFLEIGVDRGGSLGLSRTLIGHRATVFGIDINPKCLEIDGVHAKVRIGSQDDAHFLKKVVSEMQGLNFVLDDGSHVSTHVKKSFETLFPLLEPGGFYVIEDMHASYWTAWKLKGGLRRKTSAIEYFKRLVDAIHQPYYGSKTSQLILSLSEQVSEIRFYDSIILIRKKKLQSRPTLFESG